MNNRENGKIRITSSTLLRVLRVLTVGVMLSSLYACMQPAASLHLALPESPVPYDQAWRSSLEATLLFYDRIVVEDKDAGYFQTNWNIHQVGVLIGAPVKRSRLIGRVANRSPYRLDLDLQQEAFSMELGRWVSDVPDESRMKEINERLRARLRF